MATRRKESVTLLKFTLLIILVNSILTVRAIQTGFKPHIVSLYSDTIEYKSEADSLWSQIGINYALQGKITVDFLVNREIHNKNYRELGILFWEKFPNDYRKYIWLENTIGGSQGVKYFSNPKEIFTTFIETGGRYPDTCLVEYDLVQRWEDKLPIYSWEYLNSSIVTNERKIQFKGRLLHDYLLKMQNPAYRNWAKINIDTLCDIFIQSAFEYLQSNDTASTTHVIFHPLSIIEGIFSKGSRYGLNEDDIEYFLSLVEVRAPYNGVRDWVQKKRNHLLLYQNPIDLVVKLYDDKTFDIKSLRGKVVLVDFWATWCASCIAMQPRIKYFYDKYHSAGFEVVSLSIDSEDKREEVLKIMKNVDGDWVFGIIGGRNKSEKNISTYKEIFKKYGFRTVPVILVLNKKGVLVAQSGEFKSKNFENTLKLLLEQ